MLWLTRQQWAILPPKAAKPALNRLFQDANPMSYHHPTNDCCYSPTSSTVVPKMNKICRLPDDGEDRNGHPPTENNHPSLGLHCYITDICCLLRCGALITRQECSSVCGSCCYFWSEHKICQHIKSAVKTATAPYIHCLPSLYRSNKLVGGGWGGVCCRSHQFPTSA